MTSTVRTFLAIHPSAELREAVAALQKELESSGAELRWVGPEALHLTIKFLGDVVERELPGVTRALEESLATLAPLDLEARGLGVFPGWKKPRILWIGLEGEGLMTLVDAVESALSPLGFPPEAREFTPHVTVARVRSTRGMDGLGRQLRDLAERPLARFVVASATLTRSDLRPDGPIYKPIAVIPLGAPKSQDPNP